MRVTRQTPSPRLTAMPRVLLVLVLAAATMFPALASARIFIDIRDPSDQLLPIAIPEIKAIAGGDPQAAQEVLAVVENDLALTGLFDQLPRASFLERVESAGLRLGEFSFDNWTALGAVGLIKTGWAVEGDQLRVELRVYDVDAQALLVGKAFSAPLADTRAIGHRIANEILFQFTGQPGIFHSRLSCVSTQSGNKEIYVVDMDGHGLQPVTQNGSINLSPSWSHDGSRIAYTSFRDGNPDVWVTDLATGRAVKVSSRPGVNSGPSFSPDGSSIVLTLSHEGDSEIFSIDARTGDIEQRLTNRWGIDVNPVPSPDGSQLAFESSRNGSPQIFVMPADGGTATQLTRSRYENVSPAWSPDGTRLAFAGRQDGSFDIYVVDLLSRTVTAVTQDQHDNEDPSWAPDGSFIVFSSTRGGPKQLYLTDPRGRSQVRITNGRASYSNPSWAPLPE